MNNKSTSLTLDEVLKHSGKLREKDVEVPEWGGSVRIREFTKGIQQQIRKEAKVVGEDDINLDRMELLMFIYGVCDPKFNEEHYERLRQSSASAVDRVLKEITLLSGVTQEHIKEAEKKFRT